MCFVCVFDSLVAFLFVCPGSLADRVAPLQVAKLRASEEKFLHEAGLRERLALQRQQITELEAAVMEKEAAVTDLRFEVETERETSARLRRRCASTLGWACCAGPRPHWCCRSMPRQHAWLSSNSSCPGMM